MSMRSVPLLVPLAFFASCNNGSTGPTADQACLDSAKATCAKLDQCRHNGTADAYGTLGTCISRVHDNCVAALMAQGTGNTPDAVEACAMALPGESCQDDLQNNPVAACAQKTGSLGSGAACAFNAQCSTGFCAVKKGSLCGTCAAAPAIGDPCDEVTSCGPNRACTPMQTCQEWVAIGAACDNKNQVCAPGSTCVIPAMMATGSCQAEATTLDAACDFKRQTGAACDPNAGLYCANSNKCINVTYVSAGTACGAMMGTSDSICTGGASCYSQGAGNPSMCLALGKEGDACDTSAGPGCMSPGRCVTSGGTSGTCTLPDASMCM